MAEWFSPNNKQTPFGEDYLEEFSLPEERTIQEVDSIEQIIRKEFQVKPKVLDLAGGFGRISKHLLDREIVSQLVDFDLNLRFLRMARQSGVKHVVAGDLRRLPFKPEIFDMVLLMFTSFGYFSTLEEDLQTLHEVYVTIAEGGRFIMDLPNFYRIMQNFSSGRELALGNGKKIRYTKKIEEGVLVEERAAVDSLGDIQQLAPMRLRIYFSEDAQAMCRKVGFTKIELTDGNLSQFNRETSRRLWVRCQK